MGQGKERKTQAVMPLKAGFLKEQDTLKLPTESLLGCALRTPLAQVQDS